MPSKKKFLSAEWRKLAMANYVIDPSILEPHVPYGTELDFWRGRCYVSLVGFMFLNTRVLGVKVPFHVNFEEVNLRFYVRYQDGGEWKRGVVFIKEIVPKAAITLVANTLYKEHYQTMPMRHAWEEKADHRLINYGWKHRGKWNEFEVKTAIQPSPLAEGSEAEFITEHFWGYSRYAAQQTIEYQVEHPRWEVYEVLDHRIDFDPGALYGAEFAELKAMTPVSVFVAEGSEVVVRQGGKIGGIIDG